MTNQADEFAEWERTITEGTFEDALMALEKAAKRLEAGNLSLADSVRCFEVGNRLAVRCGALLDDAELRISRLDQPESDEIPF
jgi:exodeoxyribonuclease VII small subunit